MKGTGALLCMLAALAAVSPSDAASPAKGSNCSATFVGRIVYTIGVIHICNGATGVDVNTGVSGVNPKFSADGTQIVYQGNGVSLIPSTAPFTTRVVTARGGTPSFDPSGTQIAFDNVGIWKVNIDGTGLTQLTHDGGIQPSWSLDGTQIAYNAAVGGSQQIFLVNADGTSPHQVLSSGSVIDTVWRPSTRILFGILQASKNYELYSYDPTNTASLTRLTTIRGNDDEPSWSPTGTQISWTNGSGGIWVMNADGTNIHGPVIASGRQGSWGN